MGRRSTDFVLKIGSREIARRAINAAGLVDRADQLARGGDPIPELANLLGQELAHDGYRLSAQGHRELERACAKAIAQDHWPPEIVVAGENGSAGPYEAGIRPGKPVPPASDAAPSSQVFEQVVTFPSDHARDTFSRLHGLDSLKERLVKESVLLTQPDALVGWSHRHHGRRAISALAAFQHGTPLLVFAGDVGTGKTALAHSFGDAVARATKSRVHLLQMSIKSRGSGIVGEMTQLITNAFRSVQQHAAETGEITILLLDEADAMGESRETEQMHHEDRAGVNALIQGVDLLRGSGLPILVVFCTNRLSSLDPAIRRRAADVFEFRRPDEAQRAGFLRAMLGDLGLPESALSQLVELTGPRAGRPYGFTYSDLSDRLVRNAVIEAYPDRVLDAGILVGIASEMEPTRPFLGEIHG